MVCVLSRVRPARLPRPKRINDLGHVLDGLFGSLCASPSTVGFVMRMLIGDRSSSPLARHRSSQAFHAVKVISGHSSASRTLAHPLRDLLRSGGRATGVPSVVVIRNGCSSLKRADWSTPHANAVAARPSRRRLSSAFHCDGASRAAKIDQQIFKYAGGATSNTRSNVTIRGSVSALCNGE